MSSAHFIVGSACNNGCRGCLWTRRLELLTTVRLPPPEDVRGRGVRLAGREPTLRQDLGDIVRGLCAAGATSVEVETNGRMLGYPVYVRALRDAGVTRLAIKVFARDEATWDAHTRVPGSCAQTLRGIDVTRRVAPRMERIAVLVPRREAGAGVGELVDFARQLGFAHARVELRLARLDLAALPDLAADVRALRAHPPAGMHIDFTTP
jgi:molybdenum cofactor biosynthesis enzyme MoaA